MMSGIRRLAIAIAGRKITLPGSVPVFRRSKVIALSDGPPPTVTVTTADSGTPINTVRYPVGLTPRVGDELWTAHVHDDVMVWARMTTPDDIPTQPEEPPPPPPGEPPPPIGDGIWLSPAEIAALPTSGSGWDQVNSVGGGSLPTSKLTTRDGTNVQILAAALKAARLDDDSLRGKVREALRATMSASIDTGDGLAANRRFGTYIVAADLIDLPAFDSSTNSSFKSWVDRERKRNYSGGGGGGSIIGYHERRPNNYGTHAGASRIAAAVYLDDQEDLNRAAVVHEGWLGNRSKYDGFDYSELDWQADSSNPVGVNPAGARKSGFNIDGVLPDDQRRGGGFTTSPPKENYVWEALQGAFVATQMLYRQGFPAWEWQDRAMLRAITWLYEVNNFPAEDDDTWSPHLVNKAYGTSFSAGTGEGKNMAYTKWTHG